jgi:hypothetical protein
VFNASRPAGPSAVHTHPDVAPSALLPRKTDGGTKRPAVRVTSQQATRVASCLPTPTSPSSTSESPSRHRP